MIVAVLLLVYPKLISKSWLIATVTDTWLLNISGIVVVCKYVTLCLCVLNPLTLLNYFVAARNCFLGFFKNSEIHPYLLNTSFFSLILNILLKPLPHRLSKFWQNRNKDETVFLIWHIACFFLGDVCVICNN